MNHLLQLDALTTGYEDKPIVKDISFTAEDGEILSLIGPNGAGKTTLLRTLCRQLPKLAGEIRLKGEPVETWDRKAYAQTVAVVLTERLRTELMTCFDVVAAGRYPYTGRFGLLSDEDKAIVQDMMALTDVEPLADRDFGQISDGQRQRVLLARALCQEPQLLLLDEPTSFLDIRYKLEFLDALRRLSRERGFTVIMSLHEVELAAEFSDRIAVLTNGRLDRLAAPADILKEGYIADAFSVPEHLRGSLPKGLQ